METPLTKKRVEMRVVNMKVIILLNIKKLKRVPVKLKSIITTASFKRRRRHMRVN